ncbi:MAG: D-alanine--D-alanine ligase [Terrimonas sp.]|nr:D-alanine--D-alanine ligase [Terrimonas sp.]
MNAVKRILHKPIFIQLLHWEYWSMPFVYFPTYFYFLWLCIRSGWKYFFTAADPLITYGGFLMESKKEIYDSLPTGYYPKTLFFKAGTDPGAVNSDVQRFGLQYPLIVKPDIGMRGLAAKKVEQVEDLMKFIPVFTIDFLIQEFVPYKKEAGFFYYRYPGEQEGRLSGIVSKEFLELVGDGKSTLLELLQSDKRFILQIPSLKKEYKDELDHVLKMGESRELVPYGNHARGAKFIDDSHLIDAELTAMIHSFCLQVPEFYYGRLDIRYDNWEDLRKGEKFSVIELNGAGSEPTHMYDPRHSLFFAWKEIIRHFKILHTISQRNHKRGFNYMNWSEGSRMFRASRRYSKRLRAVHESLLHL